MGELEGKVAADRIDLWSRLHFDTGTGTVWLGEHRMVLLHARALGAFRNQIVASLGEHRASGLLLRMGFDSGTQDARLARTLVGEGSLEDVFLLGPRLHSLEGLVKVETISSELDLENCSFRGEFRWESSWEAETHLEEFGVGDHCTCWNQVGYASGYVTSFLGKPVYFRETMCRGKGDPYCTVVADSEAPVSITEPMLAALQPDDIAGEIRELSDELQQLRAYLRQDFETGSLIGRADSFMAAFNLLKRAASTPITVLLLGETGVGKEMFARWLHDNSARRQLPFVAINCGAIPPDLVESELFGVEAGAYTGAGQSRAGRFERADGGTLFLDEVGEMPLAVQVKLLRVLQTGEIERLGDTRTRKVDVRIVAATNVALQEAVDAKRFRADLFYRLNPYPIIVPPLRDRRGDIPLFASMFVDRLAKRYGKVLHGMSDRALQALMAYPWPGNIRELENVIERGVLLSAPGGYVELDSLFLGGAGDSPAGGAFVDDHGAVHGRPDDLRSLVSGLFDLAAERIEDALVSEAMSRADGNVAEAARLLGWTRRQLDYRLRTDASKR